MPSHAPLPRRRSSAAAQTHSLLDRAILRTTGAPRVEGNAVRVLRDAAENYPAWENAISAARDAILLEMYIVANDRTGRHFLALLTERARAGVQVKLLYDWLGCRIAALAGVFDPLIAAGGEVRASNRPRLLEPVGLLSRDHRKLLIIDQSIAFVSGLCLGDTWLGDPAFGKAPWRDTGIEIRGPAVADAIGIFFATWSGRSDVREECPKPLPAHSAPAGPVALRTVATTPATANLYRLDLLIAASVRERWWLTDAYFIGPHAYRDALRNAALDGVDVRLLVPRSSDLPWIATVSRTLYRPLLEAGVRVFEWDGPMVHAKTAIADRHWGRVGSSNLNPASLFGNWEIDVAIENDTIVDILAEQFIDDLRTSTEIRLGQKHRVVLSRPRQRLRSRKASAVRSARGAVSYAAHLSDAVSAAVAGHRPLDSAEAGALLGVGLVMIAAAAIAWFYPLLLSIPLAILSIWGGLSVLSKAFRLWINRDRVGPE